MRKNIFLTVFLLFCAFSLSSQNLINNPSFTDGWNHWSHIQEGGSSQAIVTGNWVSVITPIPAPTLGGNTFAFCGDQSGPSRNIFYQSFIIPPLASSLNIGFDIYVHNIGGGFFTPLDLEYLASFENQQIRVDLIIGSANIYSVQPVDIISMLYRTNPGDPLVSGWNRIDVSLPANVFQEHAGSSVLLRFTQVDNDGPFGMGITNVFVEAEAIPIPVPISNIVFIFVIILMIGFTFISQKRLV